MSVGVTVRFQRRPLTPHRGPQSEAPACQVRDLSPSLCASDPGTSGVHPENEFWRHRAHDTLNAVHIFILHSMVKNLKRLFAKNINFVAAIYLLHYLSNEPLCVYECVLDRSVQNRFLNFCSARVIRPGLVHAQPRYDQKSPKR